MKYLLFEESAIETFIGKSEFQSIEFENGKRLINFIRKEDVNFEYNSLRVKKDNIGIIFVGKAISNHILVFDLEQSKLIEKVPDDDSLLLILQKTFRTAIKIWHRYPFASSERVNKNKSIVFPFVYSDKHRVVIERSVKCTRLERRGIEKPLLVYNYTDRDSHRDEQPEIDILREAGENYIKLKPEFRRVFDSNIVVENGRKGTSPILYAETDVAVSSGEFMYLDYNSKIEKLTITQRKVVESTNLNSPMRIEGAAGTGKTASMILRAFSILEKKRCENQPFKIIFFSHSESTNQENKNAFSYIVGADKYLCGEIEQKIEFTTLLNYCIRTIGVNDTQVIEKDATNAKETQRILIEDALDHVMKKQYKTYKSLLSDELKVLLDIGQTPKGILISMLQHEFSVQIKGRTNGTIEEYYDLQSIKNALMLKTKKDREFIFSIFKEYQNMLQVTGVYDIDDITVETLSQLNAPIWRRERIDLGYDYIFVDEMHLFNINEQYCFHYLTKSPEQKEIPICFALDYSQAIGDRGEVQQDFIEKNFANADKNDYKTIFRSSQQITDFCAAISAAGALMFQNDYKNPYHMAMSGFTDKEERLCEKPYLKMYDNDNDMIDSLKEHIDKCRRDCQCRNREIALISFDDKLFNDESFGELEKKINKKICVINSRQSSGAGNTNGDNDPIQLFDPFNVNGLEFKCVILIGVDEGRVPENIGVSDISENYIRYIAFNQLYLTASRAKYRLTILGNKLHGESSCLKYAVENGLIEKG
ncbi:MAG: UvrD-helicase domain-containing protein [Candidatus Ornithomonoglobus sp.]